MLRDLLTATSFSSKERAVVLARAARILEARIKAGSVHLDSPALVKEWLALRFCGLEREVFGVIYLDAHNRPLDFEALFTGTLMQTSVYPREVLKAALARNAAAVMLAHNHPSECAEPSRVDELPTQALKRALELVDVKVLDHCYVQFLERSGLFVSENLQPLLHISDKSAFREKCGAHHFSPNVVWSKTYGSDFKPLPSCPCAACLACLTRRLLARASSFPSRTASAELSAALLHWPTRSDIGL